MDEKLRIKRFTREACRVFRLVDTDVGRGLADIKSDLVDCDLLPDAEQVLRTLAPVEREVRAADGACYLARLLPYRTLDNVIRGVVLTFLDITKRVEAEAAARVQRDLSDSIVDTVREPLLVLDGDLRFEVGPAGPEGDRRPLRLNARRLRGPAGGRQLILLAFGR